MPVDRVREIMKISQDPVSLETPIGEEEDSHLGDFIQDDNVEVPADAATYTLLHEQLMEVLSTLTEREQKVCGCGLVWMTETEDAGGGRKTVQCDEGADPADRGEGAPETAPSEQKQGFKGLSG